jgi:hypothetical protein
MVTSQAEPMCSRCHKPSSSSRPLVQASSDFLNLCAPCFLSTVEGRMRMALRPYDLLHEREIWYVDDDSAAAKATAHMLQLVFSQAKLPLRCVLKRQVHSLPKHQSRRCLYPLSMEEICSEGVSYFFSNKKWVSLPRSAVRGVRMVDLERYCTLRRIPFSKRQPSVNAFLETMVQTDPQTYTATLRAIDGLNVMMQKPHLNHVKSRLSGKEKTKKST